MYNLVTYPTAYSHVNASPRGGFLTYLRAGSLTVWFFTLVYRYWFIKDWLALQELFEAGSDARSYYYYGFAVALVAHLTIGIGPWLKLPFTITSTWCGRLLTLFCLLELILSPLSIVPRTSLVYAAATLGVYALACLYWESDYRIVRRMMVFAGIFVLAWSYLVLFKHGLTRGFGGSIGGINRNTSALTAYGAMICCLMSPRQSIRWAAMAAAIFMALAVSSRGTMVAMATFFAVYYTIHKGTFKAAGYSFAMLALATVVLIASPFVYDFVVERILHLYDKSRGIGSGFTGRVEMWRQALEAFWQRPFLGYGFRATTHGGGSAVSRGFGGVHSGYLKLLVETGFVGAILIVTAVIIEAVRRFRLAIMFRNLFPAAAPDIDIVESTRINSIACGTMASMLVNWLYEQNYINLGTVLSVVLFLMIAAPAYITTQGAAIRR